MASSKTLFRCPEDDIEPILLPSDVLSVLPHLFCDMTFMPRFILESLKTLFLFTKSDVKTILIPVTIFSVSTAPLFNPSSLPHLIFWIWLHILECALANQSLAPEEDAINKPDRPIPSGRITVFQARVLRWAILPVCFALSGWYGTLVLKASISLAVFLYIYNELEFNAHWLGRNVLNGAGLACFEVGATLIAGYDRYEFDYVSRLAIIISSCVFMTTIHAQDFKDELGDAKIGRRTLPMIFPVASRMFLLFALIAWSIGLAYFLDTTPLMTGIMMAIGTLVGVRFVLLNSVYDDQKTFYLYTAWFSVTNVLPALTARTFA